jgi:polyisoprenoid-binding protein YceI
MATAVQPIAGVYELDRAHSTVQFGITHVGVSTFRASFADVDARLVVEDGAMTLNGAVRVESISIVEPAEFREHVVRGADFFDADAYPEITFRSTEVELGAGGAVTVSGDLTIRGRSQPVSAQGTYEPPREDPFGGVRTGLALRAAIDRRNWDMTWQAPLPDGSDAVGWGVEITAQLELIKAG